MEYKSIFSEEIGSYLHLRAETGRYTRHAVYILYDFDSFLCRSGTDTKEITSETVSNWCLEMQGKALTKKKKIAVLRDFSKYVSSLGYAAYIPEVPKAASDYVPYIFTEDEWIRIINGCDNLSCGHSYSKTPLEIPVLIRLLYGCGLRLSEALMLQMCDINFEAGVLTIKKAKRKRQRLVPMDKFMTDILSIYGQRMGLIPGSKSYVFANHYDKPHSISWAERWFKIILKQAGIKYIKNNDHERGPCLHCLRHTFTLRSFTKAEVAGCSLDDSVPFLSTYLGHENIAETDKYLNFSYELYPEAHEQISRYTTDVFPEVNEP